MTSPSSNQTLTLSERLTEQFYTWEKRGRGWQVWNEVVDLEPPFEPFFGHYTDTMLPDDGRRKGPLSGIVEGLRGIFTGSTSPRIPPIQKKEPTPDSAPEGHERVELQALLPKDFDPSNELFEAFILSLSSCRHPVSFEFLGTSNSIRIFISADEEDASQIEDQLATHFPDVVLSRQANILKDAWADCTMALAVDFGLSREFMVPLHQLDDRDVLLGLSGALSDLKHGEVGLFQVLFQPVHHSWAENLFYAVTDVEGESFFENAPEIVPSAKEKIASPLYAAIIRIAVGSLQESRCWDIARRMTSAFKALSDPISNELIPLNNDDYPADDHLADVLARQSRRSGMLLNLDELVGLVHFPSKAMRTAKLERSVKKTKAAPVISRGHKLIIGENIHNGETGRVTLSPDQRVRHTYIIGASGTGKSTLLLNMIVQDIQNGEGLAVLDPHGDLIEEILGRIPEERIKDVILVDPSDNEYAIGFNILSAHSDLEKNLLASDLVAVFRRLSTSWGDQMNSVFSNAILAFLESSRGGTLGDLRRFLVEPQYRAEFLATVQDSHVVYYWTKEFPLLTGKPQGPILTRLDAFLRPKPIRHMVLQKENKLDFAEIMNTRKIFLAKLSQGTLGEENAYLLGSLLISKFHQLIMSRQDMQQKSRRDFWLYCDEFHHFITPSMASILSGTRKYRLGLVLAHQNLQQIQKDADVADAVLANPYTRICFRVGDQDAKKIAEGFSSFEPKDLLNLGIGEAICRVERADYDFNLSVSMLPVADEQVTTQRREAITAFSRQTYGTLRKGIETAEIPVTSSVIITPPIICVPTPIKASQPSQIAPAEPTEGDEPEVEEQPPKPLVVRPTIKTPRKKLTEASLGRGGQAHKYLQHFIKQWGEGMGYKATIEKPTLDGQGSVDVALEKDQFTVACEISITSGVEQELANLKKCISAGYSYVVMIASTIAASTKLKHAIEKVIDPAHIGHVRFCTSDDLIECLQKICVVSTNRETTINGYRVKLSYKQVNHNEAAMKQGTLSKTITKAVRRIRGP